MITEGMNRKAPQMCWIQSADPWSIATYLDISWSLATRLQIDIVSYPFVTLWVNFHWQGYNGIGNIWTCNIFVNLSSKLTKKTEKYASRMIYRDLNSKDTNCCAEDVICNFYLENFKNHNFYQLFWNVVKLWESLMTHEWNTYACVRYCLERQLLNFRLY